MFLTFLTRFITSKVAEQLIALLISKVIASQKQGIGKDLAVTMINGIVESKQNPSTSKLFTTALKSLK